MINQQIGQLALVVRDYDEAIEYFTEKLGFILKENTKLSETKRRVVVAPPGEGGADMLLAKAASEIQAQAVGNQTGGRVFLFLYTDDFSRDYNRYRDKGVRFVREPQKEIYGTVAVFEDLYGNYWDLIERSV